MTKRPVTYFDYSNADEQPSGVQLRKDLENFREKVKTQEEAAALMDRVKSAIAHIEASLAVSVSTEEARSEGYRDWRTRTEYSLARYKENYARLDGHRHGLAIQERNRRNAMRKNRLQESAIAAQRKLDEAGIQALYQTSKTRAFITILKDSGLIPQDKWRQMWDDAEQLAFNSRHEFENVQLPQLKAKVESIFAELESLNSKDAE